MTIHRRSNLYSCVPLYTLTISYICQSCVSSMSRAWNSRSSLMSLFQDTLFCPTRGLLMRSSTKTFRRMSGTHLILVPRKSLAVVRKQHWMARSMSGYVPCRSHRLKACPIHVLSKFQRGPRGRSRILTLWRPRLILVASTRAVAPSFLRPSTPCSHGIEMHKFVTSISQTS